MQTLAAIPLRRPAAWGGPAGTGRIRTLPEDFRVFEVPLVEAGGAGEHCWLQVRKRNSNTAWVAQRLAEFADVPRAAVGYAGMKDRRAVTEQWFSVHLPGRPDPDWRTLENEDLQVLHVRRHTRKLRTGALLGNRFRLRLRDLDIDPHLWQQRLAQVAAGGFPNYFGDQRFGRDSGNLEGAAQLFSRPRRRLSRHKRSLYLSAARAALFNTVLAARVADGSWNRALPGEALQLQGKSACFVCETPDEEIDARLRALEIHPTGPLCGEGETLCRGVAGDREQRLLENWRDWIEGLQRARVATARRALRAVAGELDWQPDADASGVLSFFLPAGSYATCLLGELLRVEEGP